MTLNEFVTLRREVESLKRQFDKNQGAMEQLTSRLKSEFRVKSIERAKAMLDSLSLQCEQCATECEKERTRWQNEWKALIENST